MAGFMEVRDGNPTILDLENVKKNVYLIAHEFHARTSVVRQGEGVRSGLLHQGVFLSMGPAGPDGVVIGCLII